MMTTDDDYDYDYNADDDTDGYLALQRWKKITRFGLHPGKVQTSAFLLPDNVDDDHDDDHDDVDDNGYDDDDNDDYPANAQRSARLLPESLKLCWGAGPV